MYERQEKCDVCKKPIAGEKQRWWSMRYDKKHCSNACRQKAYRERLRSAKRNASVTATPGQDVTKSKKKSVTPTPARAVTKTKKKGVTD